MPPLPRLRRAKEKSFLAVHRCTAENPAKGDGESLGKVEVLPPSPRLRRAREALNRRDRGWRGFHGYTSNFGGRSFLRAAYSTSLRASVRSPDGSVVLIWKPFLSARGRRRFFRNAGRRAVNPIRSQDVVHHRMARMEFCSLSPTVLRRDPSRR